MHVNSKETTDISPKYLFSIYLQSFGIVTEYLGLKIICKIVDPVLDFVLKPHGFAKVIAIQIHTF